VANNYVALEPRQFEAYAKAIESAGGEIRALSEDVSALVWTDYADPAALARAVTENPQLRWVQLPFAGVDAFCSTISGFPDIVFTSAKRSYSEPVAEHAMMLCMALGRKIPKRVRSSSWGKKYADSLFDENLVIVGGGGIAQQLVDLLAPMRTKVTVVRKRPEEPFENSRYSKVVGFDQLDEALAEAKFVVLACALTEETRFLFDADRFAKMRSDAYLVNVARGEVVNQDDLVATLNAGQLAGCATDVTYPEPLPEDHPMWRTENLLITPHTADTMPIVTRLFAQRLVENVSAWLAGRDLVGVVDPELGY
jgi:phosphoglycerate dehydrogenase-like enzyme